MTISGERTEQLDIFCRVTGFTSDFLSFIDVELIRFFHGALHLYFIGFPVACIVPACSFDRGNSNLGKTYQFFVF